MKAEQFTVATPLDFSPVVAALLKKAEAVTNRAAIVTLTGDLGAGKTTLTQQLARSLKITEPVVSPTFGIMKSYEIFNHPYFDQLVHIDAYRIEEMSEVGPLRFEEQFQLPRTLICIEWPERIAEVLPVEKILVTIEIQAKEERMVSLS